MKNIAIIISSLKGGGAERAVSNITTNLSKDKFNLYLILFDSDSIEYPYSGELIDINIKASNNNICRFINFIRKYFKLRKIKKTKNIDTSISFLGGPNLLNILTKNKEKVLVSVRGYTSKKTTSINAYISKYLIKKFYNNADFVIGVSDLIKDDLIKNYNIKKNKLLKIYNSYELEVIEKLSEEFIHEKYKSIFEGKVIITVGRLSHLKGQWHLIRAFKKVNEYNKDIKLVILGEGELRYYFEDLIEELGLSENVYLLGFKSNPYKYIKKSSIFVLPSLSEGFPNVLAEAMACGIPVISSDCKSGPREILAPKTNIEYQCVERELAQHGVLIPVCDGKHYKSNDIITSEENIMADAIIELSNHDIIYKQYINESIKRIQDFEISKLIKEWENIIDL